MTIDVAGQCDGGAESKNMVRLLTPAGVKPKLPSGWSYVPLRKQALPVVSVKQGTFVVLKMYVQGTAGAGAM